MYVLDPPGAETRKLPAREGMPMTAKAFDLTRRAMLAGVAAAALPLPVRAQAFPSQPIRMVVPYPPAGPTDAFARIIANELQVANGWTVVVENKPGAAGALGTREVARAEPDGHIIVLGTNQTHATNGILLKEPGYDPVADFAPIAGLADLQHALIVRKDLPAKSVQELVALAKKEPGKLNYGSTGAGSASHLAMELFKVKTGTDMVHVAFRGAAPMATEIVAGRIDAAFSTLPSVLGLIQAGEIRAIAIASDNRAPQLPDVAVLKEQGVTGGEADAWLALFAPAKTPAATVGVLSSAVMAAIAKPDVAANATKQGMLVNVRAPAAFRAYQEAEVKKWAEVVRIAQVKTD
jgi:tripartite-type tricarboxylate transporter receptor subunit TctC